MQRVFKQLTTESVRCIDLDPGFEKTSDRKMIKQGIGREEMA